MPSPRWLLLLTLPLLLAGCDDHALQQRTEEIRELSTREDRAYATEAFNHVLRDYWTLHDGAWFGKLPDGTIIQLRSPHATTAPLPSSAFYRGWHLQLTISSEEWRSYPAADHKGAFVVVYAITRHSATSWDIRVADGAVTRPLTRQDAGRLEGG